MIHRGIDERGIHELYTLCPSIINICVYIINEWYSKYFYLRTADEYNLHVHTHTHTPTHTDAHSHSGVNIACSHAILDDSLMEEQRRRTLGMLMDVECLCQ